MIKVRLPESELRIAKLSFDFMKHPMQVDVTAALVDSTLGATKAWVPANGVVWSAETSAALGNLIQAMERDIASLLVAEPQTARAQEERPVVESGIGEHVGGTTPDAPQM